MGHRYLNFNGYRPWFVDVVTIAPWGLCESDLPEPDESEHKHWAECDYPEDNSSSFRFRWYRGYPSPRETTYSYSMDYGNSAREWARRTYDLPIDTDIRLNNDTLRPRYESETNHELTHWQTEATAIIVADSERVKPIITFEDGDFLFRCLFIQEIEGVRINRNVGIQPVSYTHLTLPTKA